MRSLQNGTRCSDGVKYCGAIPILFGWFLRFPYLHVHFTCACFHSENFFGICCVVCFFFLLFFRRNDEREERWEQKPRERCMLCLGIELCCS